MRNSSKKVKELLVAANLYGIARRIHSATMGRSAAAARDKMILFFKTLLPRDALVFDVGANVGAVSRALAFAGARVVSLEPNADCVRTFELMYRHENIQIIQAAVGSHNGLANLHVSDDWDCTCTLSSEWKARMEATDERYRNNWLRQASVPLLTLDTLVEHFGEPYFIKIDVEGYEAEVLLGLSKQPPLLSFEIHKTFLEAGLRCLDLPLLANGSEFNLVLNANWGYPAQFQFAKWLDKEEMRNVLSALPGADDQGDVYVRRPEGSGRSL
jgi:FkbM family methyltransferase